MCQLYPLSQCVNIIRILFVKKNSYTVRKCMQKKTVSEVISMVMCSLGDERTSRFIELYLSNNAINTMELKYILPICG